MYEIGCACNPLVLRTIVNKPCILLDGYIDPRHSTARKTS